MKTASAPRALSARLTALMIALSMRAERVGAMAARRYPLIARVLTGYDKATLLAVAAGMAAIYTGVYANVILTSENLLTTHDTIVGGDFIVFWTVAQGLATDAPLAVYDRETMEAMLMVNFPGRDGYRLTWQYPPTMFLVIAPFASLGYVPALCLWGAGTAAFLGAVLMSLWRNYAALAIAFASAAAFHALITGQTGFVTAGLIALAAVHARGRPVLAGLAAGLLTVKPQLGLLIPIAFAAAGCWRAFGIAAATGGALAVVSFVLFGPESWIAFRDAAGSHGGMMSTDVFPYFKLITALGFLTQIGLPAPAAMAGQALVALGLAGFVFYVWRHAEQWDLRAMALIAAAPLASPYALYYELTIFIPALVLLARRGLAHGWLSWERPALIALWALPLMVPGERSSALAAIVAAGAFALCARRILTEMAPTEKAAPIAA